MCECASGEGGFLVRGQVFVLSPTRRPPGHAIKLLYSLEFSPFFSAPSLCWGSHIRMSFYSFLSTVAVTVGDFGSTEFEQEGICTFSSKTVPLLDGEEGQAVLLQGCPYHSLVLLEAFSPTIVEHGSGTSRLGRNWTFLSFGQKTRDVTRS